MAGIDVYQYPVTPLEPAISRQKLYQIAQDELYKSLKGIEEAGGDEEEEEEEEEDDDEDDDLTETGSDADSISSESVDSSSESVKVKKRKRPEIGIHLSGLNMNVFPPSVIDLFKHTVSKLNLSSNWLTGLPAEFKNMENLTYLDISNNRLTEFPSVLCQCPKLDMLDISSNQIWYLPQEAGALSRLKCLSMFNNRFEYLPPCIADMRRLRVLEIENNPLKRPPQRLVDAKENSEDQMDWLESIKEYINQNKSSLTSLIGSQQQQQHTPSDKADDKKFVLQQPPAGFRKRQPQKPALIQQQHQQQPSPPIQPFTRSFSEAVPQTATASASSNSDTLTATEGDSPNERNRSLSESLASTRAAKRMGFIVKKQNHGGDDDDNKSNGNNSTNNNNTNNNNNGGYHPANAGISAEISRHARNLSHDSSSRSDSDENTTKIRSKPPRNNKPGTLAASPGLESVSGSYFRRLSTLTEEMKPSTQFEMEDKLVEACRKLLYSLGELHSIIRRCTAFCDDKTLSTRLLSLLNASKQTFPPLVSSFENVEAKITTNNEQKQGKPPAKSATDVTQEDTNAVVEASINCLSAFRSLTAFVKANIDKLTAYIDIKFIRALIVVTFQSFNELHNAWYSIYPNQTVRKQTNNNNSKVTDKNPVAVNDALRNGENLSAADDQLYDRLYAATTAAQNVLSQLTDAISKSAAASAQQHTGGSKAGSGSTPVGANVASKVRDLTSVCVSGGETTRRLKQRLDTMRDTEQIDRRKFWDDVNAFLKAVISILGSTKTALDYLPILNDVRPNLTTLTRLTKEIPALVEYSSYHVLLSESSGSQIQYSLQQQQQQQQQQQMPPSSASSMPPPPTTPLVAALGPTAAQSVVLSPSMNPQGYSPFIPPEHTQQPSVQSQQTGVGDR